MAPATPVTLDSHDALLIVDVQNDFLPGGALAVASSDAVLPVLNRYLNLFRANGSPIVATRDWHPAEHCSFSAQGGPWPPHCVAGTEGAAFSNVLQLPQDVMVISKATRRDRDAYSGFEGTDLETRLRSLGTQRLFIGGLATDYCVLNTVKDALAAGFEVLLLIDAIKAVELQAGDEERAVKEMNRLGAKSIELSQFAKSS